MLHPVVFAQKATNNFFLICFLMQKTTVFSIFIKTYVDTEKDPEVTTDLLNLHNDPIAGKSVKVLEVCFTQLMNKWVTNIIHHAIMLIITSMDTRRCVREAKTVWAHKHKLDQKFMLLYRYLKASQGSSPWSKSICPQRKFKYNLILLISRTKEYAMSQQQSSLSSYPLPSHRVKIKNKVIIVLSIPLQKPPFVDTLI